MTDASKEFPYVYLRSRELEQQGFDPTHALGVAALEEGIAEWQVQSDSRFHFVVYGDFRPLESDLRVEPLGITVFANEVKGSFFGTAYSVYNAAADAKEKSVPSLLDAIRRINTFLGAWTLVTWGQSACGWWCAFDSTFDGGAIERLDHDELPNAVRGIVALPDDARRRVEAALYWIREPKRQLMESPRNNVLRTYSAYWNAFECLVEALNLIEPRSSPSTSEKQKQIDEFVAQRAGNLSAADIEQCYKEIVNPGLVGKAAHALRMCFGEDAIRYVDECFRRKPNSDRLYDVRNDINHGNVDAENPEELARIRARLRRLWQIVWQVFGCIVPFSAPWELDPAVFKPIVSEKQ